MKKIKKFLRWVGFVILGFAVLFLLYFIAEKIRNPISKEEIVKEALEEDSEKTKDVIEEIKESSIPTGEEIIEEFYEEIVIPLDVDGKEYEYKPIAAVDQYNNTIVFMGFIDNACITYIKDGVIYTGFRDFNYNLYRVSNGDHSKYCTFKLDSIDKTHYIISDWTEYQNTEGSNYLFAKVIILQGINEKGNYETFLVKNASITEDDDEVLFKNYNFSGQCIYGTGYYELNAEKTCFINYTGEPASGIDIVNQNLAALVTNTKYGTPIKLNIKYDKTINDGIDLYTYSNTIEGENIENANFISGEN